MSLLQKRAQRGETLAQREANEKQSTPGGRGGQPQWRILKRTHLPV